MSARVLLPLMALYELGLFAFLVPLGGGGHGLLAFLGLITSPFSVIASGFGESLFHWRILQWMAWIDWITLQWMTSIVLFLQWPVLAAIVCAGRKGRWAAIAFLLLHYGVAVFVLFNPASNFDDWRKFQHAGSQMDLILALGCIWYLGGQALLWRALVRPKAAAARVSVPV
jgi:hypothetical protein